MSAIDLEEPFSLSTFERNSALWVKLLRHFEERLAIARGKNDGDLDEATTAKLRGQIGVYKALIQLDKPQPIPN